MPAHRFPVQYVPDVLKLGGMRGLRYLQHLLNAAGVENSLRIATIAHRHVAYVNDPTSCAQHPQLRALEQRWYRSIRKQSSTPDYGVYAEPDYMAEVWACWAVYSRKYLAEITKPRSLPPFGIAASVSRGDALIVDLGNGIGLSTAALRQMFPIAHVVGTNLRGTTQWTIVEAVARAYRFDVVEDVQFIREQHGKPADLVFASEYFEHFEDPLPHLRRVLHYLCPRQMLIANSFAATAIGHFESYIHGELRVSGKQMSELFTSEMRSHGYRKLSTGLWNNRPSLWVR